MVAVDAISLYLCVANVCLHTVAYVLSVAYLYMKKKKWQFFSTLRVIFQFLEQLENEMRCPELIRDGKTYELLFHVKLLDV